MVANGKPSAKTLNSSVTSMPNKPSAEQARVVKSDDDAMATIKYMMGATIDLRLKKKLEKLDIIERRLTAMDRGPCYS